MEFTVGICTLGCKVNFYESECIAELLKARGAAIMPFEACCDVYIVNSCTVTGESDRKVMQMCRRAIRANPDALVCVIGCMSQVSADKLAAIPGIGYIGGNRNKSDVVRKITEYIEASHSPAPPVPEISVPEFDPGAGYEPLRLTDTVHTRAIVKIEDGCNSNCAYCLIHTARGPARSREIDDVVEEVRRLAAAGHKEVVLTGIELSSYAGNLPELVRRAGEVEGIERIRLGSLDPAYLTEARIDALARTAKLMPHFHISLQSGSSKTLAAMRRKYNAAMALRRIEYLKARFPGACLFADIIVGFPGETEAEFQETVEFVRRVRFLHLHIFPFSRRKGTAAASMPGQLTNADKYARAAALAEVQRGIKRELLEEVVREGANGRRLSVLFENETGGHSEEFIEVQLEPGENVESGNNASENVESVNSAKKSAPDPAVRGEIKLCVPKRTDGDVIFAELCRHEAAADIT